jgi:hypothetical protein
VAALPDLQEDARAEIADTWAVDRIAGFPICLPGRVHPAPKKSKGSFRSVRSPGHALTLEDAYLSRIWLPFEEVFHLIPPVNALLLGFSDPAWILIGFWLNVYDRLDSGHPRRVARDSLRQTALGIVSPAAFQYLLRPELPLSRWSFLALFSLYSWALLCAFWLAVRNTAGNDPPGVFSVPHNVLVEKAGASERRLGTPPLPTFSAASHDEYIDNWSPVLELSGEGAHRD